jgi:hypothetical protein
MKYRPAVILSCAAALAVLPSCNMFDVAPAARSGFNPSSAPVATRAAFLQETWVASGYRGKPIKEQFNAVYIAPVNTSFMAKQSWWRSQSALSQEKLAADVEIFAKSIRSQFGAEISNYPGGGLPLAKAPGKGVLVIELALVELVPSKAGWNAGATAVGLVVPGAGMLASAGRGSIAIEGRGRNGGNGEVFATFKDRRGDKVAPINVGGLSWYHGAEGNVADWAAEFAEVINTKNVVKRPSPVTLKPW